MDNPDACLGYGYLGQNETRIFDRTIYNWDAWSDDPFDLRIARCRDSMLDGQFLYVPLGDVGSGKLDYTLHNSRYLWWV